MLVFHSWLDSIPHPTYSKLALFRVCVCVCVWLDKQGKSTVLDHCLTFNASHYTPAGEGLIPTGDIAPVKVQPKPLGLVACPCC